VFRKVLIANRGEIAVRIARTCRDLGIPTVAVYSTADDGSMVLDLADQAVRIGPASAQRSYLSMVNVVEAARQTGADAIHPGYGFLSEDPDFAAACESSGLTFVGPPAEVLECLGNKVSARTVLRKQGIPMLEGSDGIRITEAEARQIADAIGYPVIVKAVAGGGGRAMNVVHNCFEFSAVFRRTTADAQALFVDNRVYVERYLPVARHVEVQVLRDSYGHGVILGDRDCTVQRRNQKLIEEAPAPVLSPGLRNSLSDASLTAAEATGLVGAATVEFLVDPDERFYFLEVNARLQVEHGVTEMVTGLDIVEQQLRIAANERLALRQQDIEIRGAAIECRVNAEDPDRNFRPAAGRLDEVRMPGGPFIRVDTHAFPGAAIPSEYDSLVAKVMAWGSDRDSANSRMLRALSEVRVVGKGVCDTSDFLRRLLDGVAFRETRHTTRYLESVLASGPA
jgi:acetyl-CoA carboxylase biotin carboxylase subunit